MEAWKRGGAAGWPGVAINTETNTLYLDLGNPQPDFLGTLCKGRNFYSDLMVALSVSGAQAADQVVPSVHPA